MTPWFRRQGPLPARPKTGEFCVRASGLAVCTCGLDYFSHPQDVYELSYQGEPYLHVLCDGTRVKL